MMSPNENEFGMLCHLSVNEFLIHLQWIKPDNADLRCRSLAFNQHQQKIRLREGLVF